MHIFKRGKPILIVIHPLSMKTEMVITFRTHIFEFAVALFGQVLLTEVLDTS